MSINSPQQTESRNFSWLGPELTPRFRGTVALLSVLVTAGFGLAFYLTPSTTGRGTHQQLGLPPCSILSLTNTPCPTCGMTTSFSHFVRGNWVTAAQINASGFLLACGCLMFLLWSVISLLTGRLWLIQGVDPVITYLIPGWLVIVFLEWAWRYILPF